MEMLGWLLGLGLILSGPLALIIVLNRNSNGSEVSERLGRIQANLLDLERRVIRLETASNATRSVTNDQSQQQSQTTSNSPQSQAAVPETTPKEPVRTKQQDTEETSQTSPPIKEKTKVLFDVPKANDYQTLEDDLSSKWMVWLGGIALALGGGFIVKYSIDSGLLGPTARVISGCIIGLVLLVAGEYVRQKQHDLNWLNKGPDYIPQALAGAGLFTLFSAMLAAYSLYELLSPLVTFGALSVISLSATFLAQVQGKFFAYLGVVAGLLVPILVSTGSGNAWALFPYLLVVVSAGLFAARAKAWVDVAAASIGIAMLWIPLWFVTSWHQGDMLPTSIYLFALLGFASHLLNGASTERSSDPSLHGLAPQHTITIVADMVHLFGALFIVCMVRFEHYSVTSLVLYGVYIGGIGYLVLKDAEHDVAAIFSAVGALFLLSVWHVPDLIETERLMRTTPAVQFAISPIAEPGFQGFVTVSTLLAALFGFFAYFIMPSLLRKGLWSIIGTVVPLLTLIIAYGRLNDFNTSVPFAVIALLTAALMALAVFGLVKQGEKALTVAVASYSAAATFFTALALTMVLRDAWLSFAIALEIVALAYIWRFTSITALRTLAFVGAIAVLVRLFGNTAIFEYGGGTPLGPINWLFYGYALTAALFAFSAKVFGKTHDDDRLHIALVAGAILLAVGFVTLEIHVLVGSTGALSGNFTQLEAALQTINWTTATLLLLWWEIKSGSDLVKTLRRLMTAASVIMFVFAGGAFNNILFRGADGLGSLPIINVQLLQFFVPSLLFAAKAVLCSSADKKSSRRLYGIVAAIGFFVWLTFEVRLFFSDVRTGNSATEWEIYSYSAIWLLYATALIVIGLKRQSSDIRLGGLALLALVVVKVFLGDMGSLEGIARALSFMGLGLALIGLGYLYGRLKRQTSKPSSENPAHPLG